MLTRFVLFLSSALVSFAAHPQDPGPIDTDRPDQTESSALVPARHLQLEFGLGYNKDAPGEEVLEAPTLLVRYGLNDRLELRFGLPAVTTQFSGDAETGLTDPEIGTKIALWVEEGWRPEAALLVGATIPVGSEHFSSDRIDPAFRFAFGHTLPRGFSLGYNIGAAWETAPREDGLGRDTLARLEYTTTLGYDFTKRWGGFIELFGNAPLSDSGSPAHSFDGGLTYLIRENLQLDFAAGFGLNSESPDWFITAGLSIRFSL